LRLVGRPIAFAGLQFQESLGIDRDGVGFHRGGCRDRAGDDLALHQQALHACVDQAGAELREIEYADHERDQAGEIEEDDAAGETGETLRNEECPNRKQRPPHGAKALALGARGFLAGPFGLGFLR
jgi:hypothetical protein